MAITAPCPGCGQILSVQDQYAGMQGKCPTCNTIVPFPAAPNVEAAKALPPMPPASPPTAVPPPPASESFFSAGPAPAGLASLDPLMLTNIGLGAATFFYLLLLISPFLNWGPSGFVIAGTNFSDGRMLFCLTLAMIAVVALNFLNRRFLPQAMVLAGAFATFVLLMMMGWIGAGGAGVILGLLTALGAAAACIWTAVREPFLLNSPLIPGGQSFFRTYGALLGAEAVALLLGVFYCLLRAILISTHWLQP